MRILSRNSFDCFSLSSIFSNSTTAKTRLSCNRNSSDQDFLQPETVKLLLTFQGEMWRIVCCRSKMQVKKKQKQFLHCSFRSDQFIWFQDLHFGKSLFFSLKINVVWHACFTTSIYLDYEFRSARIKCFIFFITRIKLKYYHSTVIILGWCSDFITFFLLQHEKQQQQKLKWWMLWRYTLVQIRKYLKKYKTAQTQLVTSESFFTLKLSFFFCFLFFLNSWEQPNFILLLIKNVLAWF